MVRSLRRQHVAARRRSAAARRQAAGAGGPSRGALAGRGRRAAPAGRTRARRDRVDRRRVRRARTAPAGARVGAGSGRGALIAWQPAIAARTRRGERPAERLWRLLRGLPRPAVIGALAVAASAAAVPAGLAVAGAWTSAAPQPAAYGEVDIAGQADAVRPDPVRQDAAAPETGDQESGQPAPVPADLAVRSYRVRAGDSLSEIAHTFDIDLDTLISFNGIRDVGDLREGVELSIPNASGLSYVVRQGDTLTGIAGRHGVRADALRAWNDLGSAAVAAGQRLFIPGVPLPEQERNAVLGRLFLKPAPGSITSPFGYQPDPVTGIRRFHDGVDIEHAAGTPIVASLAGRVGRVGVSGTYGRYVVLVHADGYQTLYAQLSGAQVTAGSYVAQGQTIGAMGASGFGSGSHLHFAIFKDGQPVDPSRYMH